MPIPEGDRSRLVMVPGNHDVDWNMAFAALEVADRAQTPEDLAAALHSETSEYRWDWKTQTLYRIADPTLYGRRLDVFWELFERFYAGVHGLLQVSAGSLCAGARELPTPGLSPVQRSRNRARFSQRPSPRTANERCQSVSLIQGFEYWDWQLSRQARTRARAACAAPLCAPNSS